MKILFTIRSLQEVEPKELFQFLSGLLADVWRRRSYYYI